ncbi:MAG: glycosyltransferase family 4 protein [Xanthomonadales bacterium]|nr:glycosyltransferase family 4 protein [Xanthomonadales bacterium]
MRIAAWFATSLTDRYVTGVGKHAVEMISGLARTDGVTVELLVTSSKGAIDPSATRLKGLPLLSLAMPRRLLELTWWLLRWPRLQRWAPQADWLYCPRELWLPPGRSRYALTVHDLWSLDRPGVRWRDRWRVRRVLRPALRRADLVFTVSEFTAERLQAHFGPLAHKIRVIGNGAARAYFERAAQAVSDVSAAEPPYLVSVGGLTEKKGGDRLLALAWRLYRRHSPLRLIVVGPVDASSQAARWPPNLEHIPRGGSDSELAELVRGARAALSLSRYEGFGITLVEAMAVGTPVIASDIPAHREVAGDASWLVDGDDSEALDVALAEVIDRRASREERCARAGARAAEYTWEKAVARLLSALRECA